jgi:hypothetical protein
MRPPASRPLVGRGLLIVILLVSLAFPTPGAGKGSDPLIGGIQALIGDFQFEAREIQSNVRVDLVAVPKTVPEAGFNATIEAIGDIGYNAYFDFNIAYQNTLNGIDNLVQNTGLDPLSASQLRGVGTDADAIAENILWTAPVGFKKSLAMSLRGTRLNVERFDVLQDRFIRSPVIMSAQVFTTTSDRLLFTDPGMMGGGAGNLRVGGIVGGSYAFAGDPDATSRACVFGLALPSANVDVTAEGLGGPFNGSDTADLNGKWDVCLTLKYGNYKFEADDGSSTETHEQGFRFLQPKFKF